MKTVFRIVPMFLVLIFFLTGCGFGFETETEPREPLDVSNWPTPAAPTEMPTPTPFPRATLPPTVVSQAAPVLLPTATPTPEAAAGRVIGGATTGLVQQASALAGSLSPVAVMKVSADQSTVRQGPGDSYGSVSVVEKGELGAVLGQDASGGWLYVLTITNLRGWLPLADARVIGSLAEAPVLPPNPLAALTQAAARPDTDAAASFAIPEQMLNLASLKPAATAKVSSSLLNMRQQPGPAYELVATLPGEADVEIYGLNQPGDWALIRNDAGQLGWVDVSFLTVSGSLDAAPRLPALNVTALAGQAAALLSGDSAAAVAAVAAAPTGGEAAPVETIPVAARVDNNPEAALPTNTLHPVASALVETKVDMRKGPAETFGALDTATVDLAVTVLAVNDSRDWAVIQRPENSNMGWVPVNTLNITDGFLENAQPILSALVTSNEIDVRRGPGIYYDRVGAAALNTMVSVLALDKGRSWALIESLSGGRGWAPLRLLEINGPLTDLPEISAPPVEPETPPALLPPAPAGPPAGQLVFQTASGGDIMLINADGSGLRRITSGIDPVLSPDGRQVAFTRWEPGDVGALWTANVDGSGERAIVGEMRKAKGPDWSPDGARIVLNFQQGGRVEEKRACYDLGRRPPRGAYDIRTSRNDEGETRLCWTVPPDPYWNLRVVNVADGSFENQYGGQYAFRPAWDPSQPWRIVSDAGNGLLATDVNNPEFRQQLTSEVGDGSPVLSPDGRFIVVTTKVNQNYDIFRLNADGSGRVRLTQTPLWVAVQPDQPAKQWNNVAPVWSPDGSQLAFLTDRSGRWEIWLMHADGSNQRPMFSEAINDQLALEYNFVDERMLSWR